MESQVDSCRRGTQAAAAAIVELRERSAGVEARLDGLDEQSASLKKELGGKTATPTFEALLKLKQDKSTAEALSAEVAQLRTALSSQIDALGAEVERCATQVQGIRQLTAQTASWPSGSACAASALPDEPSAALDIPRPACRAQGGAAATGACATGSANSGPPMGAGGPPALRPQSAGSGRRVVSVPDASAGSNYRVGDFAMQADEAAAEASAPPVPPRRTNEAPLGRAATRPQSARAALGSPAPRSLGQPPVYTRRAPQRSSQPESLVVCGGAAHPAHALHSSHGLGQAYFPPRKTRSGGAVGGAVNAAACLSGGAMPGVVGYCKPRSAEAAPFEEFLHVSSACVLQPEPPKPRAAPVSPPPAASARRAAQEASRAAPLQEAVAPRDAGDALADPSR